MRKSACLLIAVLLAAIVGASVPTQSAQEEGGQRTAPPAVPPVREAPPTGHREGNTATPKVREETVPGKAEDIQGAIRRELKEMWPMLFGTPRGEERVNSLYGNNPVTAPENPLLTDEDRARALQKGVEAVGAAPLKAHLAEHMKAMGGTMPTLAEWYHRIAECSLQVCPVIVGTMITSHIEHVSHLPHDIVLFDFDSDALRPEGERLLAKLAADVVTGRYHGKKVVLVGRASRIGGKVYNHDLSRRRADVVREALIRMGVAPSDITIIWLGWEPPQLTRTILEKYHLGPVPLNPNKYGRPATPGGLYAVNQSTMVILY
ncbi:MAG: OmpA family protein [Candidatus Methylomirabilales bacterium]